MYNLLKISKIKILAVFVLALHRQKDEQEKHPLHCYMFLQNLWSIYIIFDLRFQFSNCIFAQYTNQFNIDIIAKYEIDLY